MQTTEKIKDWSKKNDVEFIKNVNLKRFSYFKSGGNAQIILFPNNLLKIKNCIKFLNKNFIKFKVIGETTNLIFLDDVDYTCFISSTKLNKISFDLNKNEIVSETGVMLPELSRFALKKSLTIFLALFTVVLRLLF